MTAPPAPDLVVTGGTVVSHDGRRRQDIAVAKGTIIAVGDDLAMEGVPTVDAAGLLVLPGLVDVHVHLREPGMTEKEDFASGTSAAAAGGVTTVVDMPNTKPPVATAERYQQKLDLVKNKAFVDFGLYGMLDHDNADEIAGMAELGAMGFKLFMGQTTGDNRCPNDAAIFRGLEAAADADLVVGVHAENDHLLRMFGDRLQAEGRRDPRAHLEGRPAFVEVEAITRIITMATEAKTKLHIHHLSTAAGLQRVMDMRAQGHRVSIEALVSHLFLDDSAYDTYGNLIKLNPPIRPAADVAALWAGIDRGDVDVVATDHAPHTVTEQAETDVEGLRRIHRRRDHAPADADRRRQGPADGGGHRAIVFVHPGTPLVDGRQGPDRTGFRCRPRACRFRCRGGAGPGRPALQAQCHALSRVGAHRQCGGHLSARSTGLRERRGDRCTRRPPGEAGTGGHAMTALLEADGAATIRAAVAQCVDEVRSVATGLSSGSGPDPTVIAGIGTTAAHALKGRLLHDALLAENVDLDDTVHFDSPVELLGDSRWSLALVLSPWKQEVAPAIPTLTTSAAQTGVVDTIVRGSTGAVGVNTNSWASQAAMETLMGGRTPESVVVLGSGGSSNSVALACRRAWPLARLIGSARNVEALATWARRFGAEHCGPAGVAELLGDERPSLLVNTTTWGRPTPRRTRRSPSTSAG